jgi:hypothetical protein
MNFFPGRFFAWSREKMATSVDGASLGFFRIVWGALMIVESLDRIPKATGLFSPDFFHFTHSLTPFVSPMPSNALVYVELWVMAFCALMVMIGFGFRIFNVGFGLLFTHLFLIEKVYYNNHFYLTCLLTLLLTFTSADRCFSVKSWLQRRKGIIKDEIPLWNLLILRYQVVVVYFFGAVAKFQGDWLLGEPLRHWMGTKTPETLRPPMSYFPEVLQQEWFIWSLSYGGFFFDLVIGFLLLNRRTFWPAAGAATFFHIMNNSLFKIGFFPVIGISLLAVFFQPHWPRPVMAKISRLFDRSEKSPKPKNVRRGKTTPAGDQLSGEPLANQQKSVTGPWITAFIFVYFAIQILVPLRTLRYGGDPSWAEVGHYFSWRMMLRDKDGYMKLFFNPPEAERLLEATDQLPRIGGSQVTTMVKNPHMILQYVHALDETFKSLDLNGVEIRAVSIVSLNGRPFQLMIDPSVNLVEASYGFFEVPGWIIPLEPDQRPGLYPKSKSDRGEAINKVFKEEAVPVLKAIPRKKFSKPFEELLSEVEAKRQTPRKEKGGDVPEASMESAIPGNE